MSKKTLVIDGDRLPFALVIGPDGVRVGPDPAHPAGVFRDLRVTRVRCEVEVEDDHDALPVDEPGVLTRRALRPEAPLQLGPIRLTLAGDAAPTPAPVPPPAATPGVDTPGSPKPPAGGPWRLKVIDGGDQGRAFGLPAAGTITVGKFGGTADVGLHDFYVQPVHCSLTIAADGITVAHLDGANGTLVDGRRIDGPHELRPRQVLRVGNSHLRLEVGPFLDDTPTPVVGGPRSERMPKPAAAAEKAAEVTVGHYRLGTLLGKGYTGEVYEAVHDETGQAVALKLLAPEFPAAAAELERFVKEVKAAQPVRHPNLTALYGAGKTPTRCWIARELVPGESAAAVVARVAAGEKPSWTRAARVATHLARALDALYQHRLVHGNIVPTNVLLRADDHGTRLADFRLAQALDGSRLHRSIAERKLLAELPYLAPEQADPGAFVDHLADLYAVGAVAYALITGRPPAAGRTPTEILDHIHAGRVVRPGAVYKRTPAAFDAVVMKLLAHNQEDRHPTPAALLADLAPLAEAHDLKL